jgi:hypothetical protein
MSRLNVDQIYSRTGTSIPEIEIPILTVFLSSNQTVTNNTETTVDLNSVSLDTHNWFDTDTHRYTPQLSGYYMFNFRVAFNGSGITVYQAKLIKNGSIAFVGDRVLGSLGTTTAGCGTASSYIFEMNGSTDYVYLTGLVSASSGNQFYGTGSPFGTFLQAQLIRRT